jgi:uncharacterized protein
VIFADTSALFEAAVDVGERGSQVRAVIEENPGRLRVTDLVLAELWNLLWYRGWHHLATPTIKDVHDSASILDITPADRSKALQVMGAWAEQPFSYCDSVSFVLMERERIERVLSFDDHFRVYRYGPDRTRAFRVLP